MKFIAGIVSLIMGAMPVLAQNFEPTVTWKVRQGDTADGLTEIIFEGSIKHGWHTYGVSHKASPTVVEYTVTDGCTMEGPMYELLPTSDYHGDNVFFDTIKLGQKVRLTESAGKLEGVITSSSCEEENCGMPEDWEFSLKLHAPTRLLPRKRQDTVPRSATLLRKNRRKQAVPSGDSSWRPFSGASQCC